jgi:hypothetical protein
MWSRLIVYGLKRWYVWRVPTVLPFRFLLEVNHKAVNITTAVGGAQRGTAAARWGSLAGCDVMSN